MPAPTQTQERIERHAIPGHAGLLAQRAQDSSGEGRVQAREAVQIEHLPGRATSDGDAGAHRGRFAVEKLGVLAQALAQPHQRAVEVRPLLAQERHDALADAAAPKTQILVRRIADHRQPLRGDVALDLGAGHLEQRADEVQPFGVDAGGRHRAERPARRHRTEAARAGAPQQVVEQGLGLIGRGVAERDRLRVRRHRGASERDVARLARASRALFAELDAGDRAAHAESLRELERALGLARRPRAQTMIDHAHRQLEPQGGAHRDERIEQHARIGPARERDQDATTDRAQTSFGEREGDGPPHRGHIGFHRGDASTIREGLVRREAACYIFARSMRSRISWTLAFLCASACAPARAEPRVRNIEVYATTDVHGHMEPHAVRVPGAGHARFSERGGLALIGGYLKNARAHFPGRVLLLDGGDMFQGTLASNLSEGAAMLRGLNELGYAAAALGNHEFDYGPIGEAAIPHKPGDDPRGALRARIQEARFPVLATNLITPPEEKLVAPYALTEVDGVPIAIVGGTTEGLFQTTMRPNLEGLRVGSLATAVRAAAIEARRAGARIVIALVHAGGDCNREPRAFHSGQPDDLSGCRSDEEAFVLARALSRTDEAHAPYVDAIVGGHTHQPITAVVGGMPFIQAGKNGDFLAHLSIEVRGRGKDAVATGKFAIEHAIPICSRVQQNGSCALEGDRDSRPAEYFGPVTPDPKVSAAIAGDLARAHEIAARPIGVELPSGLSAAYGEESPLGNYAADAIRAAGQADVGFVNGGGLRADLPPGPLSYGSLYESFPFENEVVTVALPGADLLRTVLRNLRSRYGALSYSGLRVRAECKDDRIRAEITLANGRPLDPRATYKIATLDFLLRGGDGALNGSAIPWRSAGLIRTVMEKTLHAHVGALHPTEHGLFDRANPRVAITGGRPLGCRLPAEVEALDSAPAAPDQPPTAEP